MAWSAQTSSGPGRGGARAGKEWGCGGGEVLAGEERLLANRSCNDPNIIIMLSIA